MAQIHKRVSSEETKNVLEKYDNKQLDKEAAMAQLGLARSRFFDLVKLYRAKKDNFSIAYARQAHTKFTSDEETLIAEELKKEKGLIDNRNMPITDFNYSAIRDGLIEKHGLKVSVPTIIQRAKEMGCYKARGPKATHTREILTNYAGELIQHDASIHQWSPYIQEKFVAITSLDDYSRGLLFADLFKMENTWNHIYAVKSVVLSYGCPKSYYVDQHSIFRYVKNRDEYRPHQHYTTFTDDADPQWKQVLKDLNIETIYALSPQAKGKIERPYRWLQDRTVRRCAKEGITTFEGVRGIFLGEANRYNTRQIHSTTKEIPGFRLQAALKQGKTMFRKFELPAPYESLSDIFCFREKRIVDGYGRISLNNLKFPVSGVAPGQTVDIRFAPINKSLLEVRLWNQNKLIGRHEIKARDMPQVRL